MFFFGVAQRGFQKIALPLQNMKLKQGARSSITCLVRKQFSTRKTYQKHNRDEDIERSANIYFSKVLNKN